MTDTQKTLLELLMLAVEKKAIKKAIFSKADDPTEQKTVLTEELMFTDSFSGKVAYEKDIGKVIRNSRQCTSELQ
jgi:hypothetical protein